MRKFLFFGFLIFILAGAGCVSSETNSNSPETGEPAIDVSVESSGGEEVPVIDVQYKEVTDSAEVEMKNFSFSPENVTVKKGGKVTWTNRDGAKHDVSGDGWQSELLGQGGSFTKNFDEAGTFDYHCTPHPDMIGKVIVVE